MRRAAESCSFLAVAAVLLIVSAASGHAQATIGGPDNGMRTGIGYQGAFPHAKVGIDAWHFLGSGPLGVFANVKTTYPTWRGKSNYCPPTIDQCDLTAVRDTGDNLFLRDRADWLLLNAGVMYALSHDLAVRASAGWARQRKVAEFFDQSQQIVPGGSYYVPHAEDDSEIQLGGSLLLRVGQNIAMTFGYETAAKSLIVGAAWVLR